MPAMTKKGISPLMGTIILIVFALLLGGITMVWGKNYIEKNAEFVGTGLNCKLVKLNVLQVSGKDEVCVNAATGGLRVILENGPKSEINNLQLRILGANGIQTLDNLIGSKITKGSTVELKNVYPSLVGARQFSIIPILSKDAELIPCNEKAVTFDAPFLAC